MVIMKLYHGTSADNLKAILKGGFNGMRGNPVWKVSRGLNYFWDAGQCASMNGEPENEEFGEQEARRHARESAECGLGRSRDCRRVVFEIEVSTEEFDSFFGQDNSCQNMDGAVVSSEKVSAKFITRYWIDENSLDFFRCYFAGIQRTSNLKIDLDLTDAESAMVDALYKSDATCSIAESLSEMELQEITVKALALA